MSPVATLLLLLFLSGVAAANPRPLREWCTTQGATVLEAGEPFPDDFECEIRGVVGIGGSHTFELETFPVKDGDPQTDLILELRTIKGTASLEVIGPTDYWRDSHMDALRVPGMLYIIIPRTTLADHPGKYVINIVGASDKKLNVVARQHSESLLPAGKLLINIVGASDKIEVERGCKAASEKPLINIVGASDKPTYKLTVRTSSVDVLLKGGHATARESSTQQTEDGGYNETALLREVYNSCCALFDNECDHEGYLRRLVLVGGVSGNFICLKFPKEFGHGLNLVAQQLNLVTQQLNLVAQQLNLVTQQLNLVTQQLNLVAQQLNLVARQLNLVVQQLNLVAQQLNLVAQQLNLVTQQLNLVTQQLKLVAQQLNLVAQQLNLLNLWSQPAEHCGTTADLVAQTSDLVAQQLNLVAQFQFQFHAQLNLVAQQLNLVAQQLDLVAQQLNLLTVRHYFNFDFMPKLNLVAQQLNLVAQQLNLAAQQLNLVAQQLDLVAQFQFQFHAQAEPCGMLGG
eukprot:gene18357-24828_t